MPAWRGRLSPAEVDHLVAYVKAVSDFDPVPEAAAAGRDAAARLGCFACHGPQGRFDTPNPGSLKGYIPAWSGADFPELARDDGEIREWVRDGGPRRLRENPVGGVLPPPPGDPDARLRRPGERGASSGRSPPTSAG